jgi:hypothetical protein
MTRNWFDLLKVRGAKTLNDKRGWTRKIAHTGRFGLACLAADWTVDVITVAGFRDGLAISGLCGPE